MASWHLCDRSNRSENEDRFKEFYLECRDPVTEPQVYKFKNYLEDLVVNYSETGEYGLYVKQSVTDPGKMLIAENAAVSWAWRDFYPHTEKPHAPTTFFGPPSDRIPPVAHQFLAARFTRRITSLLEAADRAANPEDSDKEALDSLRYLDARLHTSDETPVLGPLEERGPWKKFEMGVPITLDHERVWNIIANNAIGCFEVRSRTREKLSQVETSEFWGIWLTTSLINHSCVPNCHAMRVGNAIIIRAAKAIAVGEELTVPYFDIFQPLSERELAARRWGFRCECPRCTIERSLSRSCENFQCQIVKLSKQLENSSALNEKIRRNVAKHLLRELHDLGNSDLGWKMNEGLEDLYTKVNNISDSEQGEIDVHTVLCASSIDTLFASYTLAQQEIHKGLRLGYRGSKQRQKAMALWDLISCVSRILSVLTKVHPGNLLCEDFFSILIQARNVLTDKHLHESRKGSLRSRKLYVTMANKYCSSYYGPHVEVFESINDGHGPLSRWQTKRVTMFSKLLS